eukprot:1988306-Pyramimonas_sp.AAC.1
MAEAEADPVLCDSTLDVEHILGHEFPEDSLDVDLADSEDGSHIADDARAQQRVAAEHGVGGGLANVVASPESQSQPLGRYGRC